MDYVAACIDEIALEGLDGITLTSLWIRLKNRKPEFPLVLDEKCRSFLWLSVIGWHHGLSFYELEQPRAPVTILDRLQFIDEETGLMMQSKAEIEDIYPYNPVNEKQCGVIGSCGTYFTRSNVTTIVREKPMLSLSEVLRRWGDRLVVVASQELRNIALCGDKDCSFLTDKQFYMLERIGRSRYYGEMTLGNFGFRTIDSCPKALHYLRKCLKRKHLIAVQPIMQRLISGQHITSKILYLPRFYVSWQPTYAIWLEKLSATLEERPRQTILYSEVKELLPIGSKSFRRLMLFGSKHVQVATVGYTEVYPEAVQAEYMAKNNVSERKLKVMKLIKPYRWTDHEDEESDVSGDEDEDVDNKRGFEDANDSEAVNDADETLDRTMTDAASIDGGSTTRVPVTLELPFLRQVYDQIEASGEVGLLMRDISPLLGLHPLDTRAIVRGLRLRGVVASLRFDVGRSRSERFFAPHNLTEEQKKLLVGPAPPVKTKLPVKKKRKNVDRMPPSAAECRSKPLETVENTESSVVASQGAPLSNFSHEDSSGISGEKSEKSCRDIKPCLAASQSSKTVRRKQIILELLESEKIISQSMFIQQKIKALENDGHIVDRKSIMRLVKQLQDSNQLKGITKTVSLPDGGEKQLFFICHRDMTDTDPWFIHTFTVLAEKYRNAVLIKEHATRQPAKPKVLKQPSTTTATAVTKADQTDQFWLHTARDMYGFLPRMTRLRRAHELLWLLIYGSDRNETVNDSASGNKTVIQPAEDSYWQEKLQKLPVSVYSKGWATFGDVIPLIPLKIFCQIISIRYQSAELDEFMSHPERQFTIVRNLPVSLAQHIKDRRKFIFAFQQLCEYLALMGLLSFGKTEMKQKEQIAFYLHRKASAVETSYTGIPRSELPIRRFTFDTLADVHQFWDFVRSESYNTPGTNMTVAEDSRKSRKTSISSAAGLSMNGKSPADIVDDGQIPGDGHGACGFDSSLFVHLRRNWNLQRHNDFCDEALIRKPIIKPTHRRKLRKGTATNVDSQNAEKESSSGTVNETAAAAAGPSSGSMKPKAIRVSLVQPNRGGRGVKRKARVVKELDVKKTKKKKLTKAEFRDVEAVDIAKDNVAKSLMLRLRVSWTPAEDSLLLLCEVVMRFLLSQRYPMFLVRPFVIRDVMHEHLEASLDKTSKACRRRIMYMLKMPATEQNVQLYVCEAIMDENLTREFSDGKNHVRTDENSHVFRNCLNRLKEKFFCFGSNNKQQLEIPDTLSQLHSQYAIHETPGNRKQIRSDVRNTCDIHASVLENLIHSSLVTSDKIGRAHELHEVCRHYPEETLNRAFDQLKRDSVVTKIKKSYFKGVTFGSTIGYYKLSQRYQYAWNSCYPQGIFESANATLNRLRGDNDVSENASSVKLQLKDTAPCSILAITLMAQRKVKFETIIPEDIVVVKQTWFRSTENTKSSDKCRSTTADVATPAAGVEDDSDAEEEQLIEQAEMERNQQAGQGSSNEKAPSYGCSSRTILWLYQCQYVHNQSVKNLNASDNIVIHSCDIRIELKDIDSNRHPTSFKTATWAHDIDAHRDIQRWNQRNLWLHPRTCHVMLKAMRQLVPNHLDIISCSDEFASITQADDKSVEMTSWKSQLVNVCANIYDEICCHGALGMTLRTLKEMFQHIDLPILRNYLLALCECSAVLRVGVTVYRYVAYKSIDCWLITINKNIKGRGNRPTDVETVVDLRDIYIPADCDVSTEPEISDNFPQNLSKVVIVDPLPPKAAKTPQNKCTSKTDASANKRARDAGKAESSKKRKTDGSLRSVSGDRNSEVRLPDELLEDCVPLPAELPLTVSSAAASSATMPSETATSFSKALFSNDANCRVGHESSAVAPLVSFSQSLCSGSAISDRNANVDSSTVAAAASVVASPQLRPAVNADVVNTADDSEAVLATVAVSPVAASSDAAAATAATATAAAQKKIRPATKRQRRSTASAASPVNSGCSTSSPWPPPLAFVPLSTSTFPAATSETEPRFSTPLLMKSPPAIVRTLPINLHGKMFQPVSGSPTSQVLPAVTRANEPQCVTIKTEKSEHGSFVAPSYLSGSNVNQTFGPVHTTSSAGNSQRLPNIAPWHSTTSVTPSVSSAARAPFQMNPYRISSVQPSSSVQLRPSNNMSMIIKGDEVFIVGSGGEILDCRSAVTQSQSGGVSAGSWPPSSAFVSQSPSVLNQASYRAVPSSVSTAPSAKLRARTSSSISPTIGPEQSVQPTTVMKVKNSKQTSIPAPAGSSASEPAPSASDRLPAASISTSHTSRPAAGPVRIRIDAARLGNSANDPAVLMSHVQDILRQNQAIAPGAQLRIRLMPPPSASAGQQPGVPAPPSRLEPGKQDLDAGRLAQLDGTADSDIENDTLLENSSAAHRESGVTDDDVASVNDEGQTSRGGSADETCRPRRKRSESELSSKHPSDGTGSYKTVKLVPRPWRTPEGTVNHTSLKTMLIGVTTHIMELPGVTRASLIDKYANVLQPVPLFELLEMLEEIGCIYRKLYAVSHKPSLFSSRSLVTEAIVDTGRETEVFFPRVDCILKLGQFIGQLQSGLRTTATSEHSST